MITLTRDEARRALVAHHALDRPMGKGAHGVRAALTRLRCIQLDPLDVIGTNADLVLLARVDGIARGDVWRHLFPGHAFEHFAKERCLLPAAAFPLYRAHWHRTQAPWWSHGERERRVPAAVVDAVLAEVCERGPVTAAQLENHGQVEALDWSGWMGTSKATTMALEILWTRCDVVVAGRTESGAKIYDAPGRALGTSSTAAPDEPFEPWAVTERVHAAGLLTRAAGGSLWSMLRDVRKTPVVDELIEQGRIQEVTIEGSSRRYLAPPDLLSRKPRFDDRVRILGPLDPLLWDRDLVRQVFDFEYVWEVYKPEPQRTWGWYVCPLLFRGALVGRIDARVERGALAVKKLWIEGEVELASIVAALERHAIACGVSKVRLPRKWSSRLSQTARSPARTSRPSPGGRTRIHD
jgi:uncharacterized protein